VTLMTNECRRASRPADEIVHCHRQMCLRITHHQQLILCKTFGAGDARVKAAFLVDPVDNTSQTPEGPKYPSAVRALRDAGLPVGITGAGLTGSCNPADANHQVRDCCAANDKKEPHVSSKPCSKATDLSACRQNFHTSSSSSDIGEHWLVSPPMDIPDSKLRSLGIACSCSTEPPAPAAGTRWLRTRATRSSATPARSSTGSSQRCAVPDHSATGCGATWWLACANNF